jgi:hypothetical protein
MGAGVDIEFKALRVNKPDTGKRILFLQCAHICGLLCREIAKDEGKDLQANPCSAVHSFHS